MKRPDVIYDLGPGLLLTKEMVEFRRATGKWPPLPPLPGLPPREVSGAYEEQEHPRYPKGHPHGGKWAPKTRAEMVGSPEFKTWFGDSKVVDIMGRPRVVYHGTSDDFSEFEDGDPSNGFRPDTGLGHFFTTSPPEAEWFTRQYVDFMTRSEEDRVRDFAHAANVMPVYLSLQNPKIYETQKDLINAINEVTTDYAPDLRQDLIDQGYDGVVIQSPGMDPEYESTWYVAFSPTQIKSATGNRGTFDPRNPDITARVMPEYEEEKHKRQPRGMPGGGQFAPKPGGEEPPKERKAAQPKAEEPRNIGLVSKNKRLSGTRAEALRLAFAPENIKFIDSIRERIVALNPEAHVNALPAVGDWADGAEESVIAVSDGDPGAFRYALAKAALEKEQKNAIHFIAGRGEDLVYDMAFPGKGVDEVAAALDAHGFRYRTFAIGKDSVRAMMVDFGGTMRDAANKLGANAGVQVHTTVGRADMIGASSETVEKGTDAAARTEAAAAYKRIISDYEAASMIGLAAEPSALFDIKTPPPPGTYLEVVSLSDPDKGADRSRVGVGAMEVPPPPPIPSLPNLSPDERRAEQESIAMFMKDPDGMVDKLIEGMKDSERFPDGPNVFSTDEAKKLFPAWNPAGENKEEILAAHALYNVAVHPTANALAKRAFLRYLDDVVVKLEGNHRSVLVTAGGVAAGKGYALKSIDETAAIKHDVGAIWDSAGEQNSTECRWVYEECKKRGISTHFAYIHADPTQTWENPGKGVVERAQTKGRMVDARLFADSYRHGAINFEAFAKSVKDDKTVEIVYIDNTGNKPRIIKQMPKGATEIDDEELYARSLRYLLESKVNEFIKRGGSNGIRIWGGPKASKKAFSGR